MSEEDVLASKIVIPNAYVMELTGKIVIHDANFNKKIWDSETQTQKLFIPISKYLRLIVENPPNDLFQPNEDNINEFISENNRDKSASCEYMMVGSGEFTKVYVVLKDGVDKDSPINIEYPRLYWMLYIQNMQIIPDDMLKILNHKYIRKHFTT